MNWDCFSTTGYISAGLWLTMPLLWLAHMLWRPRGRLVHLALVVGVLAYALARYHSATYVNRIQIDQSAQIAEAQASREKARRLVEETRKGEVAQIRFAEDTSGDQFDLAGMDNADRKFMESKLNDAAPAWKREKKTRSASTPDNDSLDAMVHGEKSAKEKETGWKIGKAGEAEEPAPILMPEAQVVLVNRLDGLNIAISRWLCWIGLFIVALDYLCRANVYREAYCPLPLPSGLLAGFVSAAPVCELPTPPRRTMLEELRWLIRRGDSFLYLTDDQNAGAAVPRQMHRLPFKLLPVEILRVADDEERMDDEFIFEALWYGRASFVVDSGSSAEQLLAQITQRLRGRKATNAQARQTAHIVWDLSAPIPPLVRSELVRLAQATGFSLMERPSHESK